MKRPAWGFPTITVLALGGLFAAACSGESTGTAGGTAPPSTPTANPPGGMAAPTPTPAPGGGTGGAPGSSAPPSAGRGSLPCDVGAIVSARCSQCHGAMPLFGAPMSLTAPEDFRVAAKDGRRKVAEVANVRILDQTMPPKSAPQLTPDERTKLADWLNQGAPAAAAGTVCEGRPAPVDPAKPQLDCKPDYVFTAQGADPASGFPVPVDDNHYQCFNLPSPFQPQEQAVAHAPLIGDARVVHHFILYVVKGTSPRCNQLKRFLIGWAPGQTGTVMPPDIGLELPNPDERLLLEVHYNNPLGLRDIQDKTGVAICTTKTPRPIEAGNLTLGSMGIRIPPRAKNFAVTGTCDPLNTYRFGGPLNVLASWPHMHRLGSKFSSTIRSAGRSDVLVDVQKWDFNDQIGYPGPAGKNIIKPGDTITTVCTYDNDQDHEVRFGENTEDEMCFNFMTVYPVSAIKVLDQVPLRMCSTLTDQLGL